MGGRGIERERMNWKVVLGRLRLGSTGGLAGTGENHSACGDCDREAHLHVEVPVQTS